jgi:hypothetical protein
MPKPLAALTGTLLEVVMANLSKLVWARVGCLAFLAAGCSGEEVPVGSEAGSGLNRCFGVKDGCNANVQSEQMDDPGARACPSEASARLEVAFELDLKEQLCPHVELIPCGEDAAGNALLCWPEGYEDTCDASVDAAKPAPDGTIWVTVITYTIGEDRKGREALWLGHIGENGEKLSLFKLAAGTGLRENTVYYETDIAVDARSHAYVAIYGEDPGPNADAEIRQHAWLAHYDPEGQPVDGVIELPGLARTFVAIADDGRLVIAGDALHNEKRAIAAVLDPDGILLWSQPKLASAGEGTVGVAGVGAAPDGRVIVYTRRPAKGWDIRFGAFSFDPDGTLEWDVVMPKVFTSGYYGGFGVDAAGNFAAVNYLAERAGHPNVTPAWLVSVDADGKPRWSYEIEDRQSHDGLSVDRESGAVFYRSGGDLLHFTSEGSCQRWALSNGMYAGQVERGPDGNFFFSEDRLVGRYKPLISD